MMASPSEPGGAAVKAKDWVVYRATKSDVRRVVAVVGDQAIITRGGRYDRETAAPIASLIPVELTRCGADDCRGPHYRMTFNPLDPSDPGTHYWCLGKP